MAFDCNTTKKALGLSNCPVMPEMIVGMITTPSTFSLTKAQALVATNWQTALFNTPGTRIFLWPKFKGFENLSEEPVYEDTPHGMLHVRDGNYRFRFHIKESLCFHKNAYTHRSTNGRVFLIDSADQIIGTIDSSGNVRGFTYELLNTEKMIFSDGAVSSKSPLLLALANNKEFDKNGYIFDGSFWSSLQAIIQAEMEIVDVDDNNITVSVVAECDGTPVEGLVQADFTVLDVDGADQPITGFADNGDGNYTLTVGGGLVAGTLQLSGTPTETEGFVAEDVAVEVAS